MLKFALLLATMITMGCNSTESEANPLIALGTYQFKIVATDGVATIQMKLNSDGTMTGKGYVTLTNGSMDCLISEGSANYAVTSTHIKMTNKKRRGRAACADAFSAWEDRPDSNEEIRNITATSFELYAVADDESPAEWAKYSKL